MTNYFKIAFHSCQTSLLLFKLNSWVLFDIILKMVSIQNERFPNIYFVINTFSGQTNLFAWPLLPDMTEVKVLLHTTLTIICTHNLWLIFVHQHFNILNLSQNKTRIHIIYIIQIIFEILDKYIFVQEKLFVKWHILKC